MLLMSINSKVIIDKAETMQSNMIRWDMVMNYLDSQTKTHAIKRALHKLM